MLTEQERKWLKQRDRNLFSFGLYLVFSPGMSPALIDYRDAAEFEARVAEKLAEHAGSYNRRNGIGSLLRPNGCSWYKDTGGRDTVCPPKHDIDDCPGIPFCNLYLARIAVEEEMENERNHA